MDPADIIANIGNLVVQTRGDYHMSKEDIKRSEVAVELIQHLLERAKRGVEYPETRVFFVTDGPMLENDDQEAELHETLEAAEEHARKMLSPRIRVCIVHQAYKQEDGSWNYEDHSDTFETIKTIEE